MKITKKDILEYRKVAGSAWHDRAWHDYMDTPKAEAIGYALEHKEAYDSYVEIAEIARVYYITTRTK